MFIELSWRDYFALISAFSLPTIPTWAGTHSKIMLRPLSTKDLFILIILLIRARLTELPPPIAISALKLSEKTTKSENPRLFDFIHNRA